MQLRINKIINLLIEFCYLSIIFLIPIFFGLWPKTSDVFSLPKIILFKILVLFFLFFTIIKFIFYKNIWQNFSQWIKNNFIAFIVPLFFLLTLAISTLFSSYSSLSFYGIYGRQMGLLSFIYFILFFFLLTVNIKTKTQIKHIIAVAVWSSVIISAYALTQAFGHDPLYWIESTKARATSTFGQPNILGAYLLLVIPLSVYLAWCSKNWFVKFAYFSILGIQLLSLFFTHSLSAWVGIISVIILTSILILSNKNKKKKLRFFLKKFRSFFSLIALIIIFFLFYSNFSSIGLNKIKYFFNSKSGSSAARIQFWQAGWQAFKKRPFLGYGLDTQGEVLARYYQVDWAVPNNINVRPNRAHNLFLDTMLTGGLLGLLAYLALLYLFFYFIFKNIKNNREKNLNIALGLGAIAYFISLQFNFSFISGEIYFWLFFALVAVLSFNRENKEESNSKILKSGFFLFVRFLTKIILIIIIAIPIFYQINKEVKKLEADHYWYALRIAKVVHNDFFEAKVLNNYIRDLKINDSYYETQYAIMISDWVPTIDQYGIIFRRVSDEKIFPEILPRIFGYTYDDYLARGRAYTMMAQAEKGNKKTAYFEKARNNLEKLIVFSSEMPRNYYELANMYAKEEKWQKAINNYNLALEKLPSLNSPGLNSLHKARVKNEMRLNYKGLSFIYHKVGDKQEEEKYKNF